MSHRRTVFDALGADLGPGASLIEASAGTGKTWSLTTLAVRMLLEGRVDDIGELLLVTFTNAATDDLRTRLRERLVATLEVLRGRVEPGNDAFLLHARRRGDTASVARLGAALRDFDRARVQTIHSYCTQLLRETAFEAGLAFELGEPVDGSALRRTALEDAWRELVVEGPPALVDAVVANGIALENFVELIETWAKHSGLELRPQGPDLASLLSLAAAGSGELEAEEVKVALRHALLERTRARLAQNKRRDAVLDYDDLIARVCEGLEDPARRDGLVRAARASTRVALIDEFQDTDARQWTIFRTLFGEGATLMLVGDPKQAIYGFRGADVHAYLQARETVAQAGGTATELDRNHRSHPQLVEAVNALFGTGVASFALDAIEHVSIAAQRSAEERDLRGDDGPAFRLVEVEPSGTTVAACEAAVIDRLVGETQRLLSSGIHILDGAKDDALTAGHLAVLTRSHTQSQAVHRAFAAAGIPSVLGRSGDVHQSDAMQELGLLLEAVLDPRNAGAVRRAVVTRLWGGTATHLLELDASDRAMSAVLDQLEEIRTKWHRFGVLVAVDAFVERHGVMPRWMRELDGERLSTDLRHALELVHRAELEGDLSPAGTLHWLWQETRRVHAGDEQRELRLARDDDAVKIVTVHASKGLEYEVVFVPFAWKGSAPSAPLLFHESDARGTRMVLDYDRAKSTVTLASRESLAEDLRLLYVALTRARRRCVAFMAPYHSSVSHSAGRSALAYLLHRPDAEDGEPTPRYVDRCLERLLAGAKDRADGRAEWNRPVSAWIGAHACIGGLPAPPASRRPLASEPAPEPAEVHARALPLDLAPRLVPWSMVSFTALVRDARGGLPGEETEETDVAERADPATSDLVARPASPQGIFAFARGARAGVCLHEILERSDFERPLDDDDRARIVRILQRHGLLDARAHGASLDPTRVAETLVETVRAERFPLGDFVFADVDRAHRLDEWEFRASLGRVRPQRLAEVFERHVHEPWCAAVVHRLRRLDARALEGLLGGFVDLVFEHRGRWYVVDWKSNHLGDAFDDYDAEGVQRAMIDHDYVLQLVLYTVALHRFLALRLADHDYDTTIGGAAYAFLRGLCGRVDRGWFAWKPPRALIEAIDAWMRGERG